MSLLNKLTVQSKISAIDVLMQWVSLHMFPLLKKKEQEDTLHLVIQEAVVNAIVHGNKEDESKNVAISYFLKDSDLHIIIEDEGDGIPKKAQKKDEKSITSKDMLAESGRGIILIKHFCKEVNFKKNILELVLEI